MCPALVSSSRPIFVELDMHVSLIQVLSRCCFKILLYFCHSLWQLPISWLFQLLNLEFYVHYTVHNSNSKLGPTRIPSKFNVQGSVHRKFYIQTYFQQDATLHSLFISGKLLYMFRVVSPPIIRSTNNCSCSSTSSTIAAGSNNGLTSTRCSRYRCVCS